MLITPCSPLGVLPILQRAPTHAPANHEEDKYDDDNQNHRHKELQQQHHYPQHVITHSNHRGAELAVDEITAAR